MGFKEDAIQILKSAKLPPEEEKAGMKIIEDAIKAEAGSKVEKSEGMRIMSLDQALKEKK